MGDLPSVNIVIVAANIIVMSEEVEKQIKLTEVYNQLEAIKTQLHELIQPTTKHLSSDASKLGITKLFSSPSNPRTDILKNQRGNYEKNDNLGITSCKPIPSKHSPSPYHVRKMNSPSRESKIGKWRVGAQHRVVNPVNEDEKRVNSAFKAVKKTEMQPKGVNFESTTLSKPPNSEKPKCITANPVNQRKRGMHGRYNSEVYNLKNQPNLSESTRIK